LAGKAAVPMRLIGWQESTLAFGLRKIIFRYLHRYLKTTKNFKAIFSVSYKIISIPASPPKHFFRDIPYDVTSA
jgi:hypothetical protein